MMNNPNKWQTRLAALLFLGASTSLPAMESIDTLHFNTPAIAFKYDDLRSHNLPSRLHTLDLPLVFGHHIELVCMRKRPGRDDVMIYVPATKACGSLNDILDSGHYGSRESFSQDRPRLVAQLDDAGVVIIRPQPKIRPYPPICACPLPEDPALIWSDGFEARR